MLTKLNKIDKNLVPWMSQFFPPPIASARPTRNVYFIHKIMLVRDKIAQIHTIMQRSYCDIMHCCEMVRNCMTVQ